MLLTNLCCPVATTSSHSHRHQGNVLACYTHLHPSLAGRPKQNTEIGHSLLLYRALAEEDGKGDLRDPKQHQHMQQPKKVISAFERAAAYKKNLQKTSSPKESPSPIRSSLDADEKGKMEESPRPTVLEDLSEDSRALKDKQESELASALAEKVQARKVLQTDDSPQQDESQSLEVEIVTRDGIVRRKVTKPGDTFSNTKVPKKTGVTSTDFLGLDFYEKKSRAKGAPPPGLAVGLEAPPAGSLPEVEIIMRDGGVSEASKGGLYKPKVVTWGVFERPADISQTYGGGRTIRPGEPLETEEQRKARDARTKELLEAYHKKIGLNVDPQLKIECVKALKQGNDLFERGYSQRAIQQFEKVMKQMPYQSELHGMAALQFAVCLDSTNRFDEARAMYEKIVTHPNGTVRKKAKQLLYGFQAMQNLKVSTASEWDASLYRRYFDAFSDGYNTSYKREDEEMVDESLIPETFIYFVALSFPLVVFFLFVVLKAK